MKKILVVLLFILTIISCGPEKKHLNLTLVFDHSLEQENYPEYVSDLLMPFSSAECEGLFVFKPIVFMRIDISNKIEKSKFWENLSARVEVESIDSVALAEWIKADFSAKAVPLLTKKENKMDENNLKLFIKKQKKKNNLVYIYSDSFMGETYDSIPVFSDISELRNDIRSKACEIVNKKIYILLNMKAIIKEKPEGDSTPPPPPPPPSDSNTIIFNYARYEGTVVNGKMQGNGTLIFLQDHKAPVPDLSTVNIFVKKGQKISGTFYNDFLVSGRLLDKDGNIIRSIIVGNNR